MKGSNLEQRTQLCAPSGGEVPTPFTLCREEIHKRKQSQGKVREREVGQKRERRTTNFCGGKHATRCHTGSAKSPEQEMVNGQVKRGKPKHLAR